MSSNRIRILFVSLLAVFAISAVASASASAALHFYVCKKAGAGSKYASESACLKNEVASGEWERVKLTAGASEKIKSTSTTKFVLKVTLLTVPVRIECNETDKGTIENPTGGGAGVDTDTLEFSGCTVTEPTPCEVEQPITAAATSLLEEVGGVAEDKFSPSGSNFTTLTLKNCGSLNGPYTVQGTDIGIVKNEKSELEFTSTSSSLTVGGAAAKLTGKSKQETESSKNGIVVST